METNLSITFADHYEAFLVMAKRFLLREPGNVLFEPEMLVHEVYLRLVNQRCVDWQDKYQVFGLVSRAMQRVLTDHARAQSSGKRNGVGTPWSHALEIPRPCPLRKGLSRLRESLAALLVSDPQTAKVIHLRYYGGFSGHEIARMLSVSTATVSRQLRNGRLFLRQEIARSACGASAFVV